MFASVQTYIAMSIKQFVGSFDYMFPEVMVNAVSAWNTGPVEFQPMSAGQGREHPGLKKKYTGAIPV